MNPTYTTKTYYDNYDNYDNYNDYCINNNYTEDSLGYSLLNSSDTILDNDTLNNTLEDTLTNHLINSSENTLHNSLEDNTLNNLSKNIEVLPVHISSNFISQINNNSSDNNFISQINNNSSDNNLINQFENNFLKTLPENPSETLPSETLPENNPSENNVKTNHRYKKMSVYQEMTHILQEFKDDKISLNQTIQKLQLKENVNTKPYCKVTSEGLLSLHNISKQPITLYAEQWEKMGKVFKSNYMDNFIKYNKDKLKFKNQNS
jgi:hypothetical protein